MPPREGFSEQAIPNNHIIWGNVLCVADKSLLIFDVNYFFTWKDKKFSEVKVIDFPLAINSSNQITTVTNSVGMFIFDHTTRDPEHNDFEDTTSILFDGIDRVREMPCRLRYPMLLTNNTFLGIDDDNDLVECNPNAKKSIRTILSFDKKKINLYGMKDNRFLVLDETNLLSIYQLSDGVLIKINEKEAVKGIEAIMDLDDNHFVCSVYENLGNETNKMKDGKTILQLWHKDSFDCIPKLEISGVPITDLKLLPNSEAILIGCNRFSVFIIDLKKNKVNIIDMNSHFVDFSIADNGTLFILINDKNRNNQLIQMELELIYNLINQPGQGVIHTHIDNLRQAPVTLQPAIAEDKTDAGIKKISIPRAPTFFGSTGGNSINTAHLTNNASTLPAEDTKPRGYKNAST
jgi:hypothetical protein